MIFTCIVKVGQHYSNICSSNVLSTCMPDLFQTMEKHRVVTYFYNLIEIPFDESALGLTTVLVKQLEKDDLYEPIQRNIVGFISDGASVMIGVKSGMDKLLRYV